MLVYSELYPETYQKEDGFPFCLGKIFIGDDFWETITPALNYWRMEDYQRQWAKGLERIKTHPTSCLVASVQHPQKTPPLVNWWILYKIDGKIHIQNHLLHSTMYRKRIGDNPFTPETCYNFIKRYKSETSDGIKYSEWVVDL